MPLFEHVIANVLAILPDGPIKSDVGTKLDQVFSGKQMDLDSLMEWIKTRPLLSEMCKAVIGVAVSLSTPVEASKTKKRAFVVRALSGAGDPGTARKAAQLYRKIKPIVTCNEAMEVASGYATGVIAMTLGQIYTSMAHVSTEAAFGVLCAMCEKMADGHHHTKMHMKRSSNPMIRHEHRMVEMMTAARAMDGLSGSSDHVEEVSQITEKARSLISAMRSMGTSSGSSNKVKEELMGNLSNLTAAMGINSSRLK